MTAYKRHQTFSKGASLAQRDTEESNFLRQNDPVTTGLVVMEQQSGAFTRHVPIASDSPASPPRGFWSFSRILLPRSQHTTPDPTPGVCARHFNNNPSWCPCRAALSRNFPGIAQRDEVKGLSCLCLQQKHLLPSMGLPYPVRIPRILPTNTRILGGGLLCRSRAARTLTDPILRPHSTNVNHRVHVERSTLRHDGPVILRVGLYESRSRPNPTSH